MNGRLTAAGHHRSAVTAANHVHGFADRMQTGGTSGHMSNIGPLEISHDGQLTGGHIDNATRNHKGRNTAGTAVHIGIKVVADHRQTADTGADRATDFRRELIGNLKTGIIQCHHAGGHAKMDKTVKTADFLHAEVLGRIKILHFTGNLTAERRGVKSGNSTDTALPLQSSLPARFDIIANRADHTETGNDDTTIHHVRGSFS
ncbi:DNA polymerase III subunit delta' [gut metagenome]|uniref:DNA polymerase III subunit delta n=1 Tax=gut metagenome TaxID=749906 RepID=J9GK10_9ZZZZ